MGFFLKKKAKTIYRVSTTVITIGKGKIEKVNGAYTSKHTKEHIYEVNKVKNIILSFRLIKSYWGLG